MCNDDSWTPQTNVAQKVYDLGFEYRAAQDIIVSRCAAWQRNVGFMWAYDVMAPKLLMIIDCEPLYFTWRGKDWLIELWKGQYGLETGAEIGVYWADANPMPVRRVTEAFRSWFPGIAEVADRGDETVEMFRCASAAEQLVMSFTLSNADGVLFTRESESHWWLTGFRWGVFTKEPADLSMNATITFPSDGMCDAFKKVLPYAYYTSNKGKTVEFTFDKPTVAQPKSRAQQEADVQQTNAVLVDQYLDLKAKRNLKYNDPNGFGDDLGPHPVVFDNFFGPLEQGREAVLKLFHQR
jgi:hypothetical protein